MTVELLQGLLLAFALVVILMPATIRVLRWAGFSKQISAEGPESHQAKGGTPTMGGLLIVAVVVVLFILLRGIPERGAIAPIATVLLVGGLGAFDDYLNAKTGEGIRARAKMMWLVVVGFVVAYQIQTTYGIDAIAVPFFGIVLVEPWLWIAFAAVAIIATSNGVNLTDGLDGLAGGTLLLAFVAYLLVAQLNVVQQPDGTLGNQPNLALMCALVIGALLGFLWFNVHPAQVFMGDAGSLSLGAMLAVIALISGQIFILPIVGIVFVVETASVLIQRTYFRLSGGRRIFKFTPLHHHFELSGWDEEKITLRFWIVGILAGLLGVMLFLASIDRLS